MLPEAAGSTTQFGTSVSAARTRLPLFHGNYSRRWCSSYHRHVKLWFRLILFCNSWVHSTSRRTHRTIAVWPFRPWGNSYIISFFPHASYLTAFSSVFRLPPTFCKLWFVGFRCRGSAAGYGHRDCTSSRRWNVWQRGTGTPSLRQLPQPGYRFTLVFQ